MVEVLGERTSLLEQTGPWCTLYLNASTGTVDTLEAGDVRPRNLRAALEDAGASDEDILAALDAASAATGQPAPVSRYVLVRNGKVELNEVLEGQTAAQEVVEVGPVPNLVPLLKHRAAGYSYLVVQVSRDDAEIELHSSLGGRPVSQEIEGSHENIKKFPGGGWAQYKYQHRTEEVWKQNARAVAEAVDKLVQQEEPRLVVLAGDERACGLVEDELSEAAKSLLARIHSHTHTGGADEERVEASIQERVAEDEADQVRDVIDHLAEREGQGRAAVGLGETVRALQQGQVETLVLDDGALDDRNVYALDAPPWICSAPEEATGAGLLGQVKAATGLVRAAALTNAAIVFLPHTVLPKDARVAGVLRWTATPSAP